MARKETYNGSVGYYKENWEYERCPEKNLWTAVLELFLTDYNMECKKAFKTKNYRTVDSMLRQSKHEYYGFVCDVVGIHQDKLVKFLEDLKHKRVIVKTDMRYKFNHDEV